MLITLIVGLIILALALYVISLIPLDSTIKLILQVVLVVIAIVYIARSAGFA